VFLKSFMSVLFAGVLSSSGWAQPVDLTVAALKFGTVNWELNTISHHELDAEQGFMLKVLGVAGGSAAKVAFQGGAVDAIVSDWLWVARQRAAGKDYVFIPYSIWRLCSSRAVSWRNSCVACSSPAKSETGMNMARAIKKEKSTRMRQPSVVSDGATYAENWLRSSLSRFQHTDVIRHSLGSQAKKPLISRVLHCLSQRLVGNGQLGCGKTRTWHPERRA